MYYIRPHINPKNNKDHALKEKWSNKKSCFIWLFIE